MSAVDEDPSSDKVLAEVVQLLLGAGLWQPVDLEGGQEGEFNFHTRTVGGRMFRLRAARWAQKKQTEAMAKEQAPDLADSKSLRPQWESTFLTPFDVKLSWQRLAWWLWGAMLFVPVSYVIGKTAVVFMTLGSPPLIISKKTPPVTTWPNITLCPYVRNASLVRAATHTWGGHMPKQNCSAQLFTDFSPYLASDYFVESQCVSFHTGGLMGAHQKGTFEPSESVLDIDVPSVNFYAAWSSPPFDEGSPPRGMDYPIESFAGNLPLGILSGYQANDDWALVVRFNLAPYEVTQSDYWCHTLECQRGTTSWARMFLGDRVTKVSRMRGRDPYEAMRVGKGLSREFAKDKFACDQFSNVVNQTDPDIYQVEVRMMMFSAGVEVEMITSLHSRILHVLSEGWALMALSIAAFGLFCFPRHKSEVHNDYKRDLFTVPLRERYEKFESPCSKVCYDEDDEDDEVDEDGPQHAGE